MIAYQLELDAKEAYTWHNLRLVKTYLRWYYDIDSRLHILIQEQV